MPIAKRVAPPSKSFGFDASLPFLVSMVFFLTPGVVSGVQAGEHDGVLAAGGQCRIEFREIARLGSLSDPASLIDARDVDVGPLPADAGWVVADDAGSVTHAYDRAGAYLGAFLRAGEGPGEISRPARAVRDRTDSLWVSQQRGRAVVIGSGVERRTIVSPDQHAVDGLTPGGLPYSVRVWFDTDDAGMPIMASGALGAVIMDRDGGVVRRIGPVRDGSPGRDRQPPQPIASPVSLAPLNDSLFLGPLRVADEPDAWVGYWSPEGAEPLVYAREVSDRLGPLPASFRQPLSAIVIGLIHDDVEGAWALARARAVSDRTAADIQREVISTSGRESRSTPWNDPSPSVANRVNRTLIFRIGRDGRVTEAALTDDAPRGFVDSGSFFSLEETAEGLLQIRIRGFSRRCEPGAGG